MRLFVVERLKNESSEHVHIWAKIISGGNNAGESILPADVGLRTIDYVDLTVMTENSGSANFAIPVGSLYYLLGTADHPGATMAGNSRSMGGVGSALTITWKRTGGTAVEVGTPIASGSKSAFLHIIGKM